MIETTTQVSLEEDQQFFVVWRDTEGAMQRGPLQVLWELISSYRVDIFNVSLIRITEDFLDFIRQSRQLQLDLAASFTHMASRLVYYKSKALLPQTDIEENEGEDRLPPELVGQLLEYRKYQTAAEKLREIGDIASGMYTRKAALTSQSDTQKEEEWLDVSLNDLIILYSRLLQRPSEEKTGDIAFELEQYSVDKQLAYLQNLLNQVEAFAFEDIFENPKNIKRGELIVTFLALLELTRQAKVVIRQKNNFGEIRIFKRSLIVS